MQRRETGRAPVSNTQAASSESRGARFVQVQDEATGDYHGYARNYRIIDEIWKESLKKKGGNIRADPPNKEKDHLTVLR